MLRVTMEWKLTLNISKVMQVVHLEIISMVTKAVIHIP